MLVQVKLFATLRRQYPHLGLGEAMPVELEDGRYQGEVSRIPAQNYLVITATKDGRTKRILRFWPADRG